MPNYIKNRLVILGTNQQIEEVFEKYNTHFSAKLATSYDGDIICRNSSKEEFTVGWFNPYTTKFKTREDNTERVGLPEKWEMEVKPAIDVFPDFKKIISPPKDDAYKDIPSQEIARNSPNWWYAWNINNWGTKWNISECETEKFGCYTFITAWSGVPELMRVLSEQNPDVEFYYEYADEDTGSNCASYKFKKGEIITSFEPKSQSKEAYDLSFKLRPHYKDDYVLIDGKYEYKEDD